MPAVIPCAVDGGAYADDGRALGDGGGVVVAHTHGQNIHLRPVVVLGIGLGQQFPHLRKKAARLGIVCVSGRNRHQTAQAGILPRGGSFQQREQAVGVDAAFAGFFADVDFHQNVLHQTQPRGGSVDFIEQPRAVHALNERGTAYNLVDFIGLQMTDKMSGLAIVGPGVGLFHKLLYVVFAEQVNGQIGAVPNFFHRAGFAGGTKAHVGRVAACGPGGGSHRLPDLCDGLGHLLFLCFWDHRTSS